MVAPVVAALAAELAVHDVRDPLAAHGPDSMATRASLDEPRIGAVPRHPRNEAAERVARRYPMVRSRVLAAVSAGSETVGRRASCTACACWSGTSATGDMLVVAPARWRRRRRTCRNTTRASTS